MSYYERNLPHWQPDGKAIFLTWRLFGSLPAAFLEAQPSARRESAGRKFRRIDRELDRARIGPQWLLDPRVADCIMQTIRSAERDRTYFEGHGHVVMPNHVRLLITPLTRVARITHWVKGVSARQANRVLSRVGRPFWQDESFDHWVRNEREFERIRVYIEQNPVTAGLANSAEQWPWSSASKRRG